MITTTIIFALSLVWQETQSQDEPEKSSMRIFSTAGEMEGFAKCYTSYWQHGQLHAAIFHDKDKTINCFVFFNRNTGVTTRGRISNNRIYVASRTSEDFPHEFLGKVMLEDDAEVEKQENFLKQYAKMVSAQVESITVEYIGASTTEPKFRFLIGTDVENLDRFFESVQKVEIEKKIAK